MQNDGPLRTIFVAFLLCVTCSVLVSTAAVKFKPQQETNKKLDIKKKLLLTVGLLDNPKAKADEIERAYQQVEPQIIDLKSGNVSNEVDVESFDAKDAAKDPRYSVAIDGAVDIAKIKKKSRLAKVFFIKKQGKVDQVVLPVHGKGLWSTLYGFLSLDSDLKTIRGFGFYEHAETPGLGGEVDNPRWKELWVGKKAFNNNGNPAIKVVKGTGKGQHEVDGLSGATITANGVQALVNFWLDDNGYGPFLAQLKTRMNNEY
jgi:Na+-transporting NADH:ubiquinone oxidoreductase subunit C